MGNPIRIDGVGYAGFVADQKGYALPPEALTFARNVRMTEGHAVTFPGNALGFMCDATVNVWALGLFQTGEGIQWIYVGNAITGGAGRICAYDGTQSNNITPAAGINVNKSDRWSGGSFNGIIVMSNGVPDFPHYWTGPTMANAVQLPWDESRFWSQADVRAQGIRPFKNFLMAWDTLETGTRYPYVVRWSDAADPGTIPSTWEPGPTNLAGRHVLPDTGGFILDILPLRDYAMIYKADSIWRASTVDDANRVFTFKRAFSQVGALNSNCVVPWRSEHIVMNHDDIVVHNGQSIRSIADRKVQKLLLQYLTETASDRAFCAVNESAREVWFAVPTAGAPYPNLALIYSMKDDVWTIRDLPEETTWLITGSELVAPQSAGDDWDTGSDTAWDTGPDINWGSVVSNPDRKRFVGASNGVVHVYDTPDISQNGVTPQCFVERDQLPITSNKDFVTGNGFWPVMGASGPVQISFYTQDSIGGVRTVFGPYLFNPADEAYVDAVFTGRYLGYRVESFDGTTFEFYGLIFDIEEAGSQ